MRLIVLRNPELNNAVWSYEMDNPLARLSQRNKHKISRVYRTKEGKIKYEMSNNERLNTEIKETLRLFEKWKTEVLNEKGKMNNGS